MIKLYHEADKISIDTRGKEVSIIYIAYRGVFKGLSLLGSDWDIYNNNNRILFIAKEKSIPTDLLSYLGKITIKGGYIANKEFEKESFNIYVSGIDYWEKHEVVFSTSTFFYENLNRVHYPIAQNKSKITVENLFTDGGEFYLETNPVGTYQGDYHKHGNGDIMTGAFHDMDSEPMYRKGSRKIYKPKEKPSKKTTLISQMKLEKFSKFQHMLHSLKKSQQDLDRLGITARDIRTPMALTGKQSRKKLAQKSKY